MDSRYFFALSDTFQTAFEGIQLKICIKIEKNHKSAYFTEKHTGMVFKPLLILQYANLDI